MQHQRRRFWGSPRRSRRGSPVRMQRGAGQAPSQPVDPARAPEARVPLKRLTVDVVLPLRRQLCYVAIGAAVPRNRRAPTQPSGIVAGSMTNQAHGMTSTQANVTPTAETRVAPPPRAGLTRLAR